MPTPPTHPKIYHITHIRNLPAIVANRKLLSDARMIAVGGPAAAVGMASIKSSRLRLPVYCHPGDNVGDYVPFYFCSRSIMLYLLHMGNHPELDYRGGQGPLVHLEADLHAAVDWANQRGRRWAFSLQSAATGYAEFRDDLDNLNEINWPAVANNWWSPRFAPSEVKEGKQAEFLMYGSFPWSLVSRIGVHSMAVGQQATAAIATADHRPLVQVKTDWYY